MASVDDVLPVWGGPLDGGGISAVEGEDWCWLPEQVIWGSFEGKRIKTGEWSHPDPLWRGVFGVLRKTTAPWGDQVWQWWGWWTAAEPPPECDGGAPSAP